DALPICLYIIAQIENHVAALDPLDHAGQQLALAALVGLNDLAALGLADFLQDDLLGRLRRDATKLHRLHQLLNGVTYVDVGALLARLAEPDLLPWELEFGVSGNHVPDPVGRVLAGATVDRDTGIDFFVHIPLFGRRRQ